MHRAHAHLARLERIYCSLLHHFEAVQNDLSDVLSQLSLMRHAPAIGCGFLNGVNVHGKAVAAVLDQGVRRSLTTSELCERRARSAARLPAMQLRTCTARTRQEEGRALEESAHRSAGALRDVWRHASSQVDVWRGTDILVTRGSSSAQSGSEIQNRCHQHLSVG